MVQILAAILTGLFLAISLTLYLFSPGNPKPLKGPDGNVLKGSISEKTFRTIGGVRQGMFIRSSNTSHPVLLYLHGGPAFPNYFLIEKYEPGLEEFFTVCYWEQRGGGLSYSSNVTKESMTFEQLTSDAIEVTHYLRERFGKDKIYIMAHSGGTPIALLATSRHPELYHAYMAMAQITDQAASEIRAYQFMMEHFTKKGDAKKVNALEKYPVTGPDADVLTFYRSAIRDQLMHEAGIGTMRHMRSVIRDIFLPSWFCRAYTLPEKMGLWRSKFSFLPKTGLHRAVISTDFAARVPRLDVPVYFFSGKHDLTVNTGLSKAYFEKLQAPLKGFYFFQHSAHSPLYEEPGRVRQIVAEDVLHLQNDLADEK